MSNLKDPTFLLGALVGLVFNVFINAWPLCFLLIPTWSLSIQLFSVGLGFVTMEAIKKMLIKVKEIEQKSKTVQKLESFSIPIKRK